MAPVTYEVNRQSSDKSIEMRKNDEFDGLKDTKTFTLDEAIEETSMYKIITRIYLYVSSNS